MIRHILLPSLAALAVALALPSAAAAQYAAIPAVPPSDADALAAQMRVVAAEPTNVDALAQAGELSTRVGDLSGAASLFARADKVDPRNGRVKAGMAEVLLRSERPGEALRFFDQAEGYGFPAARLAAERGLAYDLVGQQGRAQRDYRLVLAAGDNAEVRRRYALSLAIAGQNEAALQQLDPLIRRNDRGAWRSRAFILAMGGDAAGAGSIATTMMAPGQAQGLAPFFARLAALGPVDRAFAVHFGELRPTPQRIADARLAPAMPPLAPELVQVARATPVAAPATGKSGDRNRRRRGGVEVAAVTPAVQPMAPPAAPVTTRPAPVVAAAVTPAAPRPTAAPYYFPGSMIPHYPPRTVAPSGNRPAAQVATAIPSAPAPTAVAAPVVRPVPAATAPFVGVARPTAAIAPTSTIVPTTPRVATAAPAAGFSPASVGIAPSVQPVPTPAPVAAQNVTRPVTIATPVASAASSSTAISAATAPIVAPAPVAQASGDAVLARIADALAVPGRELAAAPVVAAEPPAVPAGAAPARSTDFPANPMVVNGRLTEAGRAATSRRRRPVELAAAAPSSAGPDEATGPAKRRDRATEAASAPAEVADTGRSTRRDRRSAEPAPAPDEAAAEPTTRSSRRGRREIAATDTAEPTTPATTRSRRGRTAAADDAPATDEAPPLDRKAAARQAAADRKALAEKKAAAEKKAIADKEAAEERKAKKAEPERYWVQVAGGANEGDLPKAWSAMKSKAPALAGHKGYTTPLRATNRVVTGPFKTDEEARAFVNTLKKQGVAAFQFTSEAGQKVSRLEGK